MLEFIAIITMIVDHIGKVFFPDMVVFQIVGRMTFIIYAYFISVGFSRSKNNKNYLKRISFIAILSQGFYHNLFGGLRLNSCFTLCLGILFLIMHNAKELNSIMRNFLCVLVLVVAALSGCEYGAYGIITIFFFYILRESPKLDILIAQSIVTIACVVVFSLGKMQLFALAAFPLIMIIPERLQKIKWTKYINYAIYPLHLMILVLAKLSINYMYCL